MLHFLYLIPTKIMRANRKLRMCDLPQYIIITQNHNPNLFPSFFPHKLLKSKPSRMRIQYLLGELFEILSLTLQCRIKHNRLGLQPIHLLTQCLRVLHTLNNRSLSGSRIHRLKIKPAGIVCLATLFAHRTTTLAVRRVLEPLLQTRVSETKIHDLVLKLTNSCRL